MTALDLYPYTKRLPAIFILPELGNISIISSLNKEECFDVNKKSGLPSFFRIPVSIFCSLLFT
jgi:hypothetical protein